MFRSAAVRIAFAALAGIACTVGGTASAQGRPLVYCAASDPEGFDMARWVATQTIDAAGMALYNRLVEFEAGTLKLVPGLAERWEASTDGRAYTFHLRRGVKFHTTEWFTPTRDLNADDVLLSFERYRDRESPFNKAYGVSSYPYNNGWAANVVSIEKLDPMSVRITLKAADSTFIANVAMVTSHIISAEYAEGLQQRGKLAELDTRPIGTGPWVMRRYDKDVQVRYDAHPAYWGGRAKSDRLVIQTVKDSAVRVQKLKAGECHVAPYPPPAEIASLKADTNLAVMEQEGLNVGYLAYNTLMAPFDKVEVRKALNMAINKEAILDAVFQGAGKAAKNPIPPTMWSYNNDTVDDPYDPEAARKMLADAGVTGLKMKIWAMPVQRPYNPDARKMAELIQADFAKVGVEAEIVSYEWGEYLERSKAKDRDGALLLGWTGDNGDPDNFLAVLLGCSAVGGSNRAQWCHQPFEDLIQKAKILPTNEARTPVYMEAQKVFKEQAPWATIAHSVVFMPMSTKVMNYKMDPLGSHRFDGVDIAE